MVSLFLSSLRISSEAACYLLFIFVGSCLQQSLKETVLVPGAQQTFHIYLNTVSELENELHKKKVLDKYNTRPWLQKPVPGGCVPNKPHHRDQ